MAGLRHKPSSEHHSFNFSLCSLWRFPHLCPKVCWEWSSNSIYTQYLLESKELHDSLFKQSKDQEIVLLTNPVCIYGFFGYPCFQLYLLPVWLIASYPRIVSSLQPLQLLSLKTKECLALSHDCISQFEETTGRQFVEH